VSPPARPKRALILAGGGLKVAAQAGALQVLLDEAGLEFDLADGASGGVFNLAMWCQGMSGTEMADAWRRTNPLSWLAFTASPWRGITPLRRFETNVLDRTWGIDWDVINASAKDATFNVYNFTRHELTMFTPAQMDANKLIAGVTLPSWFPPRFVDGDVYIDSVYATDANLESAVERGAEELWIIWTMSELGAWRNGWIQQYFQSIEAAANSRLKLSLAQLQARHPDLVVKKIHFEVPMHYILVFSADTLHAAVEVGVREARRWCAENDIELAAPAARAPDRTGVTFTETMRGFVAPGATEPIAGEQQGRELQSRFAVRFTVDIDGLKRFIVDPEHAASITGTVSGGFLGGDRPASGTFSQFVYRNDPSLRRMTYSIGFEDAAGEAFRLEGTKALPNPLRRFHPWRDATTLYTTLVRESDDEVVAAGILTIGPLAFLRQLLTLRTAGGRLLRLRYFAFFVGLLGRLYLRGRPQTR
jgi:predicted acylesterase/phospholipase RssA